MVLPPIGFTALLSSEQPGPSLCLPVMPPLPARPSSSKRPAPEGGRKAGRAKLPRPHPMSAPSQPKALAQPQYQLQYQASDVPVTEAHQAQQPLPQPQGCMGSVGGVWAGGQTQHLQHLQLQLPPAPAQAVSASAAAAGAAGAAAAPAGVMPASSDGPALTQPPASAGTAAMADPAAQAQQPGGGASGASGVGQAKIRLLQTLSGLTKALAKHGGPSESWGWTCCLWLRTV